VKEPKPPADLGVQGRKLFRRIVADAAGQGVELTAQELTYLTEAGKLADTIARLEAGLDGAALILPGYMNKGSIINPAVSELRMHRELLTRVLMKVKTDLPDATGIPLSTGTSNRFRAAARARWDRGGA
jgi:hypothetical protein